MFSHKPHEGVMAFMTKPVSVQHVAGRPIADVQRCERCGMVLIDHSTSPKPFFGIFDSGRPERRYIRTPQECGPCSPTKHFSAAWLYRICRRHTGKRDYDETSILDFYNF